MRKELRQKVASIRHRHTEQLQSFGYQDVYIEISHSFNPTREISSIYGMTAFFWNGNYGYKLYLSARPCSGEVDITDPRFSIISWFFLISVNTVKESKTLNTVNIREYITQYFAKWSEFLDINISRSSHENGILLNGFSKDVGPFSQMGKIKIFLQLERSDVEYDLEHPYEFDDDEDAELPEGHEFLKKFKQNFDEFLKDEFRNEKLELNGYEIEIGRDLFEVRLTVYNHSAVYYLGVRSYKYNLFDDDTENAFCDIIWSFLHKKDNQENFHLSLHEDHFHIIDETIDNNSFIVYRNLNPYKITIHTVRELFPKKIKTEIDFDHMDGHAFERFCADVLSKNDFERITVTRGSGDQGVDIIAFKDGIKYGFQCKCHSSDIGNKAVQEVFAGKTFYECHVGVVLTNKYFTKSAIELAQKNGILLWDRKKLVELIKKAFSNESIR